MPETFSKRFLHKKLPINPAAPVTKIVLFSKEIFDEYFVVFTDYTGEINTDLLEVSITSESQWKDKMIMDANIPEEILIVMIKRDNKILVPKGSTIIKEGDTLILSGKDIKSLI